MIGIVGMEVGNRTRPEVQFGPGVPVRRRDLHHAAISVSLYAGSSGCYGEGIKTDS